MHDCCPTASKFFLCVNSPGAMFIWSVLWLSHSLYLGEHLYYAAIRDLVYKCRNVYLITVASQNVTSQHFSKMTIKPLKTHYLTLLKSNQSSNWIEGKFLHLCVMTPFNGHFTTLNLITVSRSRLPTTP